MMQVWGKYRRGSDHRGLLQRRRCGSDRFEVPEGGMDRSEPARPMAVPAGFGLCYQKQPQVEQTLLDLLAQAVVKIEVVSEFLPLPCFVAGREIAEK